MTGVPQHDPTADAVTLATIRDWAERYADLPASAPHTHGEGYDHAVADVLAILAAHGKPASEPVIFANWLDRATGPR
jgi:hypothetical protein